MRRKLFKKDRFCLLQILLLVNLFTVLFFGLVNNIGQYETLPVDATLIKSLDSKWNLPTKKEKIGPDWLKPENDTTVFAKLGHMYENRSQLPLPLSLDLDLLKRNFTQSPDMIGCDQVNRIKIIKRLGKGTSKEVHLGKLDDLNVAVKRVTSNVEDVTACTTRRRYWKVEECFLYANYKLLKEILIRQQLNHPGFVKLLGYCVRSERISKTLSKQGVVEVTEVGSPLSLRSIKSWPFKRKLKFVEGVADILDYLEHSPLGSLSLTDFKLSQMFLFDGVLKIGDLDDINNSFKECTYNSECLIDRKDFGIRCSQFICQNYNAKFNLYKFHKHIIREIFVDPPKSVEEEISSILADLKELRITAKKLYSRIKTLVNEFVRDIPTENNRMTTAADIKGYDMKADNFTSKIKPEGSGLLILDLIQRTELNATCQGIITIIMEQFIERLSKEEQLMKVVGWNGYSDHLLYRLLEEGNITAKAKYRLLLRKEDNFEVNLDINHFPATFKYAPARTYGERHIAQLAFFITDRILGTYLTLPTKGIFLKVDILNKTNGDMAALNRLVSASKEVKNGSLPGTMSISVRKPWKKLKTFKTNKLNSFPAILGKKLNKRAKKELEFRMLLWLTGSSFLPSENMQIQDFPIASDNDKSFREKNEDQLNYFNYCQFPKTLVDILRFTNGSSHDSCKLSTILMNILNQDVLKPQIEDFGVNVGFKTNSILIMDEYANTLLKIVEKCVIYFGEENVLY